MHVINKSLEVTLGAPSLIAMLQMVIAVVVVAPMSIQSFRQCDIRQMRTWLLVPFCFAGMLCTSFYTYAYISLSLLTVIRNLAPLIVLPIERLIMPVEKQPHIGVGVVMSILIMLLGALIYGGGLSELSVTGVAFAVFNMLLAVTDRVMQRRLLTGECKDLPSNVCTVMNNFVGICPLMGLAAATGQLKQMSPAETIRWLDPCTGVLLVLSGLVGIGICYIGFECQRAISATSFFVLQNISKVAVVTCGVTIFQDPIKSAASILGLLLSLSGSALYGKIQLQNAQLEKLERKKLQP
jgi:drug/metabolite transporter (DMT)-like permease